MAKDNGGSAFPVKDGNFYEEGMSLRDYFAAKAMQSIFNFPDYKDWGYNKISEQAYKLSDAMLEAREE